MSTKRHTVQKVEATTVEWWPAERVIPYARNPRTATDTAVGKVAASIKEFGFRVPIIVDGEGVIIAGHTRLAAAQRLGLEFDLSLTGLSDVELDGLDGIHELGEKPAGSLAERFGAPPFSVFDARQGYWQERKRAWQALGIKSELGRGESITYAGPEIQDIGYCARRRGAARAFREDLMRGEVGLGAKR